MLSVRGLFIATIGFILQTYKFGGGCSIGQRERECETASRFIDLEDGGVREAFPPRDGYEECIRHKLRQLNRRCRSGLTPLQNVIEDTICAT